MKKKKVKCKLFQGSRTNTTENTTLVYYPLEKLQTRSYTATLATLAFTWSHVCGQYSVFYSAFYLFIIF